MGVNTFRKQSERESSLPKNLQGYENSGFFENKHRLGGRESKYLAPTQRRVRLILAGVAKHRSDSPDFPTVHVRHTLLENVCVTHRLVKVKDNAKHQHQPLENSPLF